MFGVDYAFYPHPSVSVLRSSKVTFVGRYISDVPANDTNGKNLIQSEYKALRSAGIGVVLVVEYYAQRMMEGKARGRADALHADSVVKALGMPGLPIFFAADWDATPADQAGIDAYLDGAASAIGLDRVGLYGGYYPVKRSFDNGTITYAWQTYAWSGGLWDERAQLHQYRNGVSVGGASVDFDESVKPDFGQWPRPKAPKPVKPPKPPKKSGPIRHEADGHMSLSQVAEASDVTVETLVGLAFGVMDSGNKLAFAEYLGGAGRDNPMPAKLVYYTPKGR